MDSAPRCRGPFMLIFESALQTACSPSQPSTGQQVRLTNSIAFLRHELKGLLHRDGEAPAEGEFVGVAGQVREDFEGQVA